MSQAVLITGATGTIGRNLAKIWIAESDATLYVSVHKTARELVSADFATQILGLPPAAGKRLRLVPSDITKLGLGWSESQRAELTKCLTTIVHSAAVTEFNQPLTKIRSHNVTGTRQLLQLADQCEQLQAFAQISTAYVAGQRTGNVREQELAHRAGFTNTYEQSKYEAEMLVAEYRSRVPAAVYRLSTVLGNSQNGTVTHYTAPHQALRMMQLGLASMVPGLSETRIDLIPEDYAARSLFQLLTAVFRPGRTYHLTAPPETCLTLRELIDASYQLLGEHDPAWSAKHYPKPAIVNRQTFELFVASAQQAGNTFISSALSALGSFTYQLTLPKNFDRRHTLEDLPQYDVQFPSAESYYRKVVAYCLATNWGRHQPTN